MSYGEMNKVKKKKKSKCMCLLGKEPFERVSPIMWVSRPAAKGQGTTDLSLVRPTPFLDGQARAQSSGTA